MTRAKWLTILLALPNLANAASLEFESFTLKPCAHWMFSSDSYPSPSVNPMGHKNYLRAEKLLSQRYPNYAKEGWSIFSAHNRLQTASATAYGACRLTNESSQFECLPGFDFPLSSLSYRIIKYRGQLATYTCALNCEPTKIQNVYDMGYENMEGERNIAHEIKSREFARICRVKTNN